MTIVLVVLLLCINPTVCSPCVVAYISSVDANWNASDWQGRYVLDGTQASCPRFIRDDGERSLSYDTTAWSLSSTDISALASSFSLPQSPSQLSSPCDPPVGSSEWQHSQGGSTTFDIQCSSTPLPTSLPSESPTDFPTRSPTQLPTNSPSSTPTLQPTLQPTSTPTTSIPTHSSPSFLPTVSPTFTPTISPTISPTSTPTRAPTTTCERIELHVSTPSIIDRYDGNIPIDGVFYAQTLSKNGQIWYAQLPHDDVVADGRGNYAQIVHAGGAWHIIDVANDIHLSFASTQSLPPHRIHTGYPWSDLVDVNFMWNVVISCSATTLAPTVPPTFEPTLEPTLLPTFEPSVEPTFAMPSFFPTLEPTIESSATTLDTAQAEAEFFLDAWQVSEWLTIIGLLIFCGSLTVSLCVWRNRRLERAQKNREAHHLSAGDGLDDVEMVQQQPLRPAPQRRSSAHKRESAGNAMDVHQRKPSYRDVANEVDFAQSLALVHTKHHKQSHSLYANAGAGAVDNDRVYSHTFASKNRDDVEMVQQQPLRPAPQRRSSAHKRESAGNAMDVHQRKPSYRDVANEVEFAQSLALVHTKQSHSLYANAAAGAVDNDRVYSHTFASKPFGMEWKSIKNDDRNLYVSRVAPNSQASKAQIAIGSKLIAFDDQRIEDTGVDMIYATLERMPLPLTITFVRPSSSPRASANMKAQPKVHEPQEMKQAESDVYEEEEEDKSKDVLDSVGMSAERDRKVSEHYMQYMEAEEEEQEAHDDADVLKSINDEITPGYNNDHEVNDEFEVRGDDETQR